MKLQNFAFFTWLHQSGSLGRTRLRQPLLIFFKILQAIHSVSKFKNTNNSYFLWIKVYLTEKNSLLVKHKWNYGQFQSPLPQIVVSFSLALFIIFYQWKGVYFKHPLFEQTNVLIQPQLSGFVYWVLTTVPNSYHQFSILETVSLAFQC